MAGLYNGTTSRYLQVGGAGVASYPSTGWTVFCMFNPTSSQNLFAYMHGHAQPLAAGVHAVNMLLNSGRVRMIVDVSAGNVVDQNSTPSYVADVWNAAMIIWDGVSMVKIWLNGVKTQFVASAFGTVSPTVDVRIGYASHGGSRQFDGLICHSAKFARAFTDAEGERYTKIFVSPAFAQQNADFHVEAHRGGGLAFDLVGNSTVTEVGGMVYGPHAPASYPMDAEESIGAVIAAAANSAGNQFSFA